MAAMKRVFAVLVFACACGGGSKQAATTPPPPPTPDPIPATAGPDCTAAAEQIANLAPDHSQHVTLVNLVTARCRDDGWSDEARSCFATAQADDELEGCAEQKLTAAQRDAIEAAARELGNAQPDAALAGSKPPPPAPESDAKPRPKTRGVQKKPSGGADPCMGGE
jgi:hypothetical protein